MANGFSLQEMMSKNKDFARGYLFYVFIDWPSGTLKGGLDSDKTRYLVRSTNLPSSAVEVATTNWQGNAYKLGTTQTFEDFTITFNVDIGDNIRHSFLKWTELIHNAVNNEHGKPQEGNPYMKEVRIWHLNQEKGDPVMDYRLVGAWPSTVGQIALDYATKDVATFDITFTYQYHTTGSTGNAPGGQGNEQHT